MNAHHLGSETFAAIPEQTATARRWLGELLGSTHPAHDDSVLLLSETMTNSVVHGTGDKVEVSAFTNERFTRVEVVDEGSSTVPHYVDDPCGENGRGLPIMRALAHEWGFEVLDGGRLKVWYDIRHDREEDVHRAVPSEGPSDGSRQEGTGPGSTGGRPS